MTSQISAPTTSPTIAPPKRRRWPRILRRVLMALVVIVLLLIYVAFPLFVSRVVTGASTRPLDRRLTSTPADYGAEYKDVEFQTSDGVKISGWLLPSKARHCTIIYSHGLFRSRRELMERAIELWRLGYGALLYDSRNHGNSGEALVTLGYNERLDAKAAVRFMIDQKHTEDRLVLFGISMGAAAALLAAAETPEVAAVISDSSYLSFDDTVTHHVGALLHLPSFPLANEMKYFIQERGEFNGKKLNMLEAVAQIGDKPILFLAAAHDKRMPPSIAQALYNAAVSTKKDIAVIDGPGSEVHAHGYQANPELYVRKASEFLDAALRN